MNNPNKNEHHYDKVPLLNIGVVSRMTGISMANLRAWERRYNFPIAKRTEGGHRLYSEYDVYQLKWVKEKILSGMQTASAINLFRHQEQINQIDDTEAEYQQEIIIHEGKKYSLASIKTRLIDALVSKNIATANELLGNALSVYTPEDIILEVIGPAMAAIGEKWEKKQINVAIEHLVTNYLRQRLMMWMLSSPPSRSMKPVLLTCAPQEWHEGSLLILGTLLRRKRFPIAYLGQAVPLSDLSSFINEIKPVLVVIVAMGEDSARGLSDLPKHISNFGEAGKPIIGFGGRIFVTKPEFRMIVPGVYLGDTFTEGLNKIEQILNASIG